MAQSSVARRIDASAPEAKPRAPQFGGRPPGPPVRAEAPIGSNAWLAVLIFLGAEAMFFAGLIGAFIVFRVGSPVWPPPFQPRLPLGVTGVNTVILVLSAFTMRRALSSARAGRRIPVVRFLAFTAALGGMFLLIQGYEWMRLIHFGLTVSSSVYGGIFYTLIGFHGAHVLGALIWLFGVFFRARHGRYTQERHVGLQTCAMYWTFVVALWPILYGLVYLY